MPRPQGPNVLAGLYYDFSIPLGLHNIIQTIIGNSQHDVNTPEVAVQRAPREWYSQPRPCADTTVEVLSVHFKLPLSVGQLGFKALRVPCTISAFYQDRHNNWVPMTDDSNSPIKIHLSYSATANWYTYSTAVYPIIGTAVQLRIQRTVDPQMGTAPYVVGISEMLIRRNVHTINDTTTAIEDQQDVLGNTITSYVKHWDASNVIDNDPTTFWRSFPCPDPNGVVSLYLDTRDASGAPQLIDTVYIDPIYTGNALNLYYSNDTAQGTLIINPVSLPPDTQVNATWTQGVGLSDTSGPDLSESSLLFPLALGPLVSEPIWIGIEWTPDFVPASGPPDNPILFSTLPTDGGTAEAAEGQHWVSVYYDVGAGYITCEFTNGTDVIDYHLALSPAFTQYAPLQIVVGWVYDPPTVFISVTQQGSTSLGATTFTNANLPNLITLDGQAGYTNFRGLMTALVVKAEPWSNSFAAFQAGATIYANPNPVQPDSRGNYPSTSLDNAVLAVDWTTQQFPIGGTHESWYENKTWTPIFADYLTRKGHLFLPQSVAMSYLKMEFTNLTAEPYPVYDQGISVSYDTFPVSVITTSIGRPIRRRDEGFGLLTLGGDIPTNSIGSVNWFNPSTIQNAVNANYGMTQPPVQVVTGPGTISTSLPNTAAAAITNTYRSEQNSPWLYSRKMLSGAYLAGQFLTEIGNSPTSIQTMQAVTNGATSTEVANTFSPVTTVSTSNVLPQQGADWWLFPGANMKMPASVMRGLIGHDVVTDRAPSPVETRIRFTGTSVHRYNIATLTLDAAVAYFCGMTEVQTYTTAYITGNDPPSFTYAQYDPTNFVYNNINQLVTGPLTTAGSPYVIANPNFYYPLELSPWTATGKWYWDSQHGLGSENNQGDEPCAAIVADGRPNTLVSEPIPVAPGDELVITAWVAYYNVGLNENQFPVTFPAQFGASDVFPMTLPLVFGSPVTPETGGETLSISGVAYYTGDILGNDAFPLTFPFGFGATVDFAMPPTSTTYTVSTQQQMLSLHAHQYDSATITTGSYQGTWVCTATPSSNFNNWLQTGYGTLIYQPTGTIDGHLFVRLTGTYTVPLTGVDALGVSLNVGEGLTSGNIYWSNVQINPSTEVEGTVFLDAHTTSSFADVAISVNDSGVVTSDSMWARADPLDTNIANLQLAPYVNTIPSVIPSGMWDDTFSSWDSASTEWGEPRAVVALTVDPNLVFQGNRTIHFSRAAGAGDAGILITQQTNMTAQALAQLGCTFFKPTANTNQITLSLRRVSDGVYIYTEIFTPVVGYWYTHLSAFFELPDTSDQVYTIEFVASGDDADEMYLATLFTNVAAIRYFLQLGGAETTLFDITPTVYGDNPNVSCTLPVQEFALTIGVFSPNAWAFGCSVTPRYLK